MKDKNIKTKKSLENIVKKIYTIFIDESNSNYHNKEERG